MKKAALVATALLAVIGASCAPAAPARPAFVVNTTADTLDGVCDAANCSIRDAIAASNALPFHAAGLPNEIQIPAGTYSIGTATPIAITKPVVINGAGSATTTLDLTASPIAAPGGVIDPQFAVILSGLHVTSSTTTPTHVLASCAGHLPKGVTLINSKTTKLAAVTTSCDNTFVGAEVQGPRTVITPGSLSATASTLPFADETLVIRIFSFLNTKITGPTNSDGTTADSTLTIHPPAGANVSGSFTGSHFERVGLSVGNPSGGSVFAAAVSSSFNLAGESGARTLEVIPGSSLRLNQTSVYGGGAGGSLQADGTLILQGATIAGNGPAVVVGTGATVTSRRSILTATNDGPVCTAPITLTARNVLLGASCGTPSATDITVGTHAALELGAAASNGSLTPTFSLMPAVTSPAIDSIPKENSLGLDCPFNVEVNSGTTLDQRGFFRPSGVACDAGAVEHQYPAPPVTTTTTTIATP